MLRRRVYCVLAVLLASVIVVPQPAAAGGLLGWLKKPYIGPAPNNARNPGRFAAVPPAHQRYYAYNVEDYPWLNNGYPVPTYNWGYFGAHFRPSIVTAHPYYEDSKGSSYRPGD